jgi:hypothetical protein
MKSEKEESSCCNKTSCCSSQRGVDRKADFKGDYITGWVDAGAEVGKIPLVSTRLSNSDRWGALKVRLAIKRMNYSVEPGLYGVGNPDADSIVLVTANYKLSFDMLRKEFSGIDAWILVLDTRGINVWCAAGKGTFGTAELVKRIDITGLKQVVNHRRLLVPQLGAVGVAAHTVRKESGFSVIYGPVRASDLVEFLQAGLEATAEMRQVRFSLLDRIKVAPVEMVQALRYLVLVSIAFFLLSGFGGTGYSLHWRIGLYAVLNLVCAYLSGTVLGPLLLPWLPGRSFSLKGAAAGFAVFLALLVSRQAGSHLVEVMAWLLLIPALSSFLTMNYTGASTYTSLSGVKREMRIAVPLQFAAAVVGTVLWITGRFI